MKRLALAVALLLCGVAHATTPGLRTNGLQLGSFSSGTSIVTNGIYWNSVDGLPHIVVGGNDFAFDVLNSTYGIDTYAPRPLIFGGLNATWGQFGDPYAHEIGIGVNTQPTYGLHVLGGGARFQTINQPQNVAVTPTGGTAGTSWAYYVVGVDAMGNTTQPSSTISIANGVATLTSSAYNAITWTAQPAACFHVVRTTAGGTPSTTGIIAACIQGNSFNDVGLTAGTFTAPTRNATGDVTIDGALTVSANITGPLSITGPVTINGGNNHTTGNQLIDGTLQPGRTTFGDTNFTITGVTINAITASLTAPRVASVACTLGSTGNPVVMIVKDEGGGATGTNTVTITPTSGTIDGGASKVCISSAFGSCRFYSRGANCYTF
jgi:hypothetical protein